MLTDRINQRLSEQVYWVEEKRKDVEYHLEKDGIYYYDFKQKELGQFEVIDVKDDLDNDMQAMAVAPVIDGKTDTSQIIIAYAGTNDSDGNDLETDLKSVVFCIKLYTVLLS